jgi:diguanylate cyclase (GGDEF)-like protein/PAS domain S-box-containing protein
MNTFSWKHVEQQERRKWALLSASALSIGIWSMHFLGVYAMQPPIPVHYDATLTITSFAFVILATFAAYALLTRSNSNPYLLLASLVMGTGIAGMHYIGMAAIHADAIIIYDKILVSLSVLIAFAVAVAALLILRGMQSGQIAETMRAKIVSALIMGIAISGMHYTGMVAASYVSLSEVVTHTPELEIDADILVVTSAIFVIFLVAFPLFTAGIERRWLKALAAEHEEIRASENRLGKLLNNIAEAVVSTDAKGTMKLVNKSAEILLGYKKAELVGNNVRMIMPEPYQSEHDGYMQRYLRTGVGKIIDVGGRKVQALHKSGKTIPVELVIGDLGGDEEHREFIAVMRDISMEQLEIDRLNDLANFDQLTGLFNRYSLEQRLDHAIAMAKRQNTILAVMFIDLDGFKAVNDTYGHDVGDELLKAVAAIFLQDLRESDTVARLGGDEFCMVLEGIGQPDNAANVAEKLRMEFSEPLAVMGHELDVTVSIGIALSSEDGANTAELLKAADTAMYAAKKNGKNQYMFYSSVEANETEA